MAKGPTNAENVGDAPTPATDPTANTGNPATGDAPNTGTPPEGTGLPSDTATPPPDPFRASEESIVDGKIAGKWNSVDDIIKSADEAAKAYQREKSAQHNASDQAAKQAEQQSTIMDMLPEYRENGYQVTPEMEAKLVEQGLDARDIKITAMELKGKLDTAHSVVGGAETYNQMIKDMGEIMTPEQKNQFDKDVQGGMSEYAIKGLHQEWMEKTGRRAAPDRIRGDQPSSTHGTVKPYSTQAELLADARYLQSAQGRNDAGAQRKHMARRRVTPDSVIYGR